MIKYTKCINKILSSRKLAIYLIAGIALISVFGMVLPAGKKIFKSILFLILIFCFLVNLIFCTSKQIFRHMKKRKFIGYSIFHLSLIVITIGALLTLGFSMNGYLVVGLGEIRGDKHENYAKIEEGKFFNERHGRFNITLKDQTRYFKGEKIKYTSSLINIGTNSGNQYTREISYGNPVTLGNLMFYHHNSGYAPLIEVKENGKIVMQSYVIFRTEEHPNLVTFSLPAGKLPGTNITWQGVFYPDAAVDKKGNYFNKTQLLRNLLLKLSVDIKGKSTPVVLKKGQTLAVGGYEFKFEDLSKWTGFDVIYDPGRRVVMFGGVLMTIGLVLMYLPLPQVKKKKTEEF